MASIPEFDPFIYVEEALARLVHASYAPDARAPGPASNRSADAHISRSSAATLGPADLRARIPREQRSLGTRGTPARVAIAVCLGVSAIWAWRSYGGPAPRTPGPIPEQAASPHAVETFAPPSARSGSQVASIEQPATAAAGEAAPALAARQQVAMRDLAALRQSVERLAAGQRQLTREIAKLRAEKPQIDKPPAKKPDRGTPRRVPAHPAPPVAAARIPAPTRLVPPQAAPQVSMVSRFSPPPRPAPQSPSEPQSSARPSLRPPMPVPQL